MFKNIYLPRAQTRSKTLVLHNITQCHKHHYEEDKHRTKIQRVSTHKNWNYYEARLTDIHKIGYTYIQCVGRKR
jgi:hypothetical protein